MAASSYNATTGAPEYADTDAPDAAVNPTEVAAFAASVGTRLIGDNTTMGAYGFAREGLQWWNTTDDTLYQHDGSSWKPVWSNWRAYTPTATNITGGTLAARWRRDGSSIKVVIRHTLASAGVTGQPSYTLPFSNADTDIHDAGRVLFRDASVPQEWSGWVRLSSTTASPYVWNVAAGTNLLSANTGATNPMTWASGDFLEMSFEYLGA